MVQDNHGGFQESRSFYRCEIIAKQEIIQVLGTDLLKKSGDAKKVTAGTIRLLNRDVQ
jgi:hypothetical protein